jgi:eukaryotic translation initiation factor 2C
MASFIHFCFRSHIRFQPVDKRDEGRNGNAPSGTLVNRDIVSPDREQPEFYLLSQGGLLGTSVPARYTVLLDEQIKRDEQGRKLRDTKGLLLKIPFGSQQTLYSLSFLLCHTQQRATRVVSLPTPVYCE